MRLVMLYVASMFRRAQSENIYNDKINRDICYLFNIIDLNLYYKIYLNENYMENYLSA